MVPITDLHHQSLIKRSQGQFLFNKNATFKTSLNAHPFLISDSPGQIKLSLDSKPGGLLSKRGFRRRTFPLEMHYKQGAYFREGAYYPDYTVMVDPYGPPSLC